VYHDDDIKNDCFRKYAKVEDSYEDHSQFLKRPRYAGLYELEPTDYKAWANGLKQCGYATDPNYANRLITIIETYELYAYDQGVKKEAKKKNSDSVEEAEDALKPQYLLESKMGTVPAYVTHPITKAKGKKAIIARAGDTYESIAKEFRLRKWEIRWYTKVKKGTLPEEGQPVFLQW
jgi:hypothetical protein